MAKSYFKKAVLTSPVRLSNGTKAPFINVGENMGVLETDDEFLVAELSKCVNGGNKCGVQASTKAEFDSLKKNTVSKSPKLPWQPTLSQDNLGLKPSAKSGSSSPAAAKKPTAATPATEAPAAPKTDEPALATGVFVNDQPPLISTP